MSTGHVIPCGCCSTEMSEDNIYVDPDLNAPVCPSCKIALNWAHAHLRRRTAQGVSITGIHGPREQSIPFDPRLSQAELDKLNGEGK